MTAFDSNGFVTVQKNCFGNILTGGPQNKASACLFLLYSSPCLMWLLLMSTMSCICEINWAFQCWWLGSGEHSLSAILISMVELFPPYICESTSKRVFLYSELFQCYCCSKWPKNIMLTLYMLAHYRSATCCNAYQLTVLSI